MKEKYYASLAPSETSIFRAASNIYAAYANAGKITDENDDEMVIKSVKTAIKICSAVEENVRSDNELL